MKNYNYSVGFISQFVSKINFKKLYWQKFPNHLLTGLDLSNLSWEVMKDKSLQKLQKPEEIYNKSPHQYTNCDSDQEYNHCDPIPTNENGKKFAEKLQIARWNCVFSRRRKQYKDKPSPSQLQTENRQKHQLSGRSLFFTYVFPLLRKMAFLGRLSLGVMLISTPAIPLEPVKIDTFVLDVPLTYPNSLGSDPKFKEYSPEPLYQAGEFFKLTTEIAEANDPQATTVKNLHIDWTRVGPWLPWMKMRGKPGYLVYSAIGKKVDSFEQLAPILKAEITSRMPLYRQAPRCFLAVDNETSWSYFSKYFDAYLQKQQFPIPAPVETDICE